MGTLSNAFIMLLLLLFTSSASQILCLSQESYQEPQEAFSQLQVDITVPGDVDQVGNLTIYRYGPAINDKWVLWGHDIYGVDSGRTKEYCNKMFEDLGVTCILPDFFRGADGRPDPIPVWTDELSRDWEDLLVPYLELGEAKSMGLSVHALDLTLSCMLLHLELVLSKVVCLYTQLTLGSWSLQTRMKHQFTAKSRVLNLLWTRQTLLKL